MNAVGVCLHHMAMISVYLGHALNLYTPQLMQKCSKNYSVMTNKGIPNAEAPASCRITCWTSTRKFRLRIRTPVKSIRCGVYRFRAWPR